MKRGKQGLESSLELELLKRDPTGVGGSRGRIKRFEQSPRSRLERIQGREGGNGRRRERRETRILTYTTLWMELVGDYRQGDMYEVDSPNHTRAM